MCATLICRLLVWYSKGPKIEYKRAKSIIEEHREALKTIADALLEFETIEGKHVQEVLKEGKIISSIENNDLIRKKNDQKNKEEKREAGEKKKPEIGPSPDAAGAIA